MPLTGKGEKIKGAMEEKYGAEKGEKIFYASKNKGTISGVDSMSYKDGLKELASKADALMGRWDAFMKRRGDAFEEARHPRNQGGVFAPTEGEEGKEDSDDREELRTGGLSKRT
jgi:hypothetical protein